MATFHRGYLYKEGGSALVTKWQKRWLSLESTSVSYSKQPDDVPLGMIYIEDVVAVMDLAGDKRIQQKNAFKITCINRDYIFYAETPEDKTTWMNVLKEACLKKEQLLPSTTDSPYHDSDIRHFVTVEQFLVKGVRVKGHVPISLLAQLSPGVSPDSKRVDEKGWFADIYFPVSFLINCFVSYGFEPVSLYQSEAISSLDPTSAPVAVNLIIFARIRVVKGYDNSSQSSGVNDSNIENIPPKPKASFSGALRLLSAENVALKHVPKPVDHHNNERATLTAATNNTATAAQPTAATASSSTTTTTTTITSSLPPRPKKPSLPSAALLAVSPPAAAATTTTTTTTAAAAAAAASAVVVTINPQSSSPTSPPTHTKKPPPPKSHLETGTPPVKPAFPTALLNSTSASALVPTTTTATTVATTTTTSTDTATVTSSSSISTNESTNEDDSAVRDSLILTDLIDEELAQLMREFELSDMV